MSNVMQLLDFDHERKRSLKGIVDNKNVTPSERKEAARALKLMNKNERKAISALFSQGHTVEDIREAVDAANRNVIPYS